MKARSHRAPTYGGNPAVPEPPEAGLDERELHELTVPDRYTMPELSALRETHA